MDQAYNEPLSLYFNIHKMKGLANKRKVYLLPDTELTKNICQQIVCGDFTGDLT